MVKGRKSTKRDLQRLKCAELALQRPRGVVLLMRLLTGERYLEKSPVKGGRRVEPGEVGVATGGSQSAEAHFRAW